jgi:hypothetical protein
MKKYLTDRQCRIKKLQSYVDGTQYEGRKHFLDQSDPSPPILERAPHVIAPVVENATSSHVEFLFGDGRAPSCNMEIGSYRDMITAGGMLLKDALETGECYAIVGVSGDENVSIGVIDPADVKSTSPFVIEYPYENEKRQTFLHRRVIDETSDTTFFDVEAPSDPKAPVAWRPNPERTITHGLGFIPVVYWKRGVAIHEKYFDEIDALNRTLSQRNRAALYAGDPQMYEVGVSSAEAEQSAVGRFASADKAERFYTYHTENRARVKGVSTVWSSANENAEFGMLTLPGDALRGIDEECQRLREILHEAFSYVDLDLSKTTVIADLSGKALELLYRRQIAFCGVLRAEVERHILTPLVMMIHAVMGVFVTPDQVSWEWGRWFDPTPGDAINASNAASAAVAAGILSLEDARAYVAYYFRVRK